MAPSWSINRVSVKVLVFFSRCVATTHAPFRSSRAGPMALSSSTRRLIALALLFVALPVCCSFDPTPRRPLVAASLPNYINASAPLNVSLFDDLVDASLLPDFWNSAHMIDERIKTNGDAPEQLVKVTDRRHRFPVFATACSLAFLLTIIAIIVVCTH